MTYARKSRIMEAAVPEIASEIADALHRVADAFETLACIGAIARLLTLPRHLASNASSQR
jgi:hypothetical protein